MYFIRTFIIAINLTLINMLSVAQQYDLINVEQLTDCNRALNIAPVDSFGFTTPPPGSGKVIEYKKNPEKSLYYFEDEHHTSWYRLQMPYDGILAFDIVPLSIDDDYDFILYKYTDSNFCKDVKARKILPERTAISRNDKSIGSKTGLSSSATQKFIHSGPGESYSSALKVRKGETYYLVLDNCYNNGAGHKIIFRPMKEFVLRGITLEQQSQTPVKATVILVNLSNYDTVATTVSDPGSGSFELHGLYKDSIYGSFELNINAPGYFYYDTTIDASSFQDTRISYSLSMLKFEKGKNIRLNNINFYGNTTIPYPETKYTFVKLLKVMRANPKLKILIEGHVNGCRGGMEYSQNLSDARAKAVKNYLVRYGINPSRISTIGFSCQKMLYPDPKNEEQSKLNRRVEIKIISF